MSAPQEFSPVIRQHIAGQGYYAQVVALKGNDSGKFAVVSGCFHHHDTEQAAQNCANRMYRTFMNSKRKDPHP